MFTNTTKKGLMGFVVTAALSYTASAGCNSGLVCNSGSSSFAPAPMAAPALPGLGMSESLSPTSCPVSVYNPEGGQVMGCYNVVKPAPMPAPVMQQPIVTPVTTYNQVRVVRPIVKVPYPVPTPVMVARPMPMPMPACAPMPMARPGCYSVY